MIVIRAVVLHKGDVRVEKRGFLLQGRVAVLQGAHAAVQLAELGVQRVDLLGIAAILVDKAEIFLLQLAQGLLVLRALHLVGVDLLLEPVDVAGPTGQLLLRGGKIVLRLGKLRGRLGGGRGLPVQLLGLHAKAVAVALVVRQVVVNAERAAPGQYRERPSPRELDMLLSAGEHAHTRASETIARTMRW